MGVGKGGGGFGRKRVRVSITRCTLVADIAMAAALAIIPSSFSLQSGAEWQREWRECKERNARPPVERGMEESEHDAAGAAIATVAKNRLAVGVRVRALLLLPGAVLQGEEGRGEREKRP